MLYILSCYGNKPLDKLISGVMDKEITHTAIQITERLVVETGAFGVKITDISKKNGKFHRHAFKDITLEEECALKDFILDSVETRYDYKLMVGLGLNKLFGINLDWDDPHKYICVEVIVEAVRKVLGVELLPHIEDKEIGPWHIWESPYLKKEE